MTYSIEVTPEMREKARWLHRECFVADAHYDLLSIVCGKRLEGGRKHVIEDDYLRALREGGVNLLICSLFVDDRYLPEMALRRALDQIACMHEEIDECGELALCRSTAEIRAAKAAGKIALLLSFEGVEPLGNDLSLLRVFYSLGVRGIGLVWSRRNYAADGCFFKPVEEGRKGGITHWGVKLIAEAERLGMYLDVSHLNDEGFWDLTRLTQRPFMASHSNCRALTPVMRNLDDDQMKALAERRGVMGMNCCGSFACKLPDTPANDADLADHGAHVKDLIGARSLCFGFDFCDEMRVAKGQPPKDCFPYYDDAFNLTAQLIARGFSDEELRGVLGENILAFLARTIG